MIERSGQVPPQLRRDLADRGYLSLAAPSSARGSSCPKVAGDINVAFTLTEPTAGTGADLRWSVTHKDDTYYLSGGEAPDHLRRDL